MIVALVVVLVVVPLIVGALLRHRTRPRWDQAPSPSREEPMTDQERIAALEGRVAVLEQCLTEVEQKLKLRRRPGVKLLPPPPPALPAAHTNGSADG